MKVILHYSDHEGNMSSWFDVLRASGHLPFDLTYDELFYDEADDTTEEWLKTEYKPMFEHGFAVGIAVRPEAQVQRDLDTIDAGIDDFARKALGIVQDLKNMTIERDFYKQKLSNATPIEQVPEVFDKEQRLYRTEWQLKELQKKLAAINYMITQTPNSAEDNALLLEKISNLLADYGLFLRSCVLFQMETPAQATELFEQFKHSMSAEYFATRQYADAQGAGNDYAKAFHYDKKSLCIRAIEGPEDTEA